MSSLSLANVTIHALAAKLVAVTAMIAVSAVSAVHDFILGPAAGRVAPGTPHALALRRRPCWTAACRALATACAYRRSW